MVKDTSLQWRHDLSLVVGPQDGEVLGVLGILPGNFKRYIKKSLNRRTKTEVRIYKSGGASGKVYQKHNGCLTYRLI